MRLQLFRERLSEKVSATIPKGIVGGFEFTVLQRNLKELARKAMKMCLRVLTESNKSKFISHINFRDCRVHIFSDNLTRNSCILWAIYHRFDCILFTSSKYGKRQLVMNNKLGDWSQSGTAKYFEGKIILINQ